MTIHGFLTETTDFCRLYDYLDTYDEVKAVEIPGHNGEANFDDFTVKATLKTVLSAYDTLREKHDEVDVVGFSMGGALTTWVCAQRDVHRAVLLAPANKYFNFLMPIETIKFYGEHGIKPYFDKNSDGSIREKSYEIKKFFTDYFNNLATSVKIFVGYDSKITPRIYNVFRNIIKTCNKTVEQHSPVETPTLVLWGKLDELVPHKSVKYVLQHFVNAQNKIYEDIGHAMLYTNRDEVIIEDIMDFLKRETICYS